MRNPYEDILYLPYPEALSKVWERHHRMNLVDRAKIFSPFAALRGYETEISNKQFQNLNVQKNVLLEDSREELDEALSALAERLEQGEHPSIKVLYFVQNPNLEKGIGFYRNLEGKISKFDIHQKTLTIEEEKIPFSAIQKILL